MSQPVSGGLIVGGQRGAIGSYLADGNEDNMNVVLLVGNDQVIRLEDLQDSETYEAVNTAFVTAQIKTLRGVDVGDVIELEYVTDSDGDYRGLIPDELPIENDTYYIIELTATTLSGDVSFWRFKRAAQYRQP